MKRHRKCSLHLKILFSEVKTSKYACKIFFKNVCHDNLRNVIWCQREYLSSARPICTPIINLSGGFTSLTSLLCLNIGVDVISLLPVSWSFHLIILLLALILFIFLLFGFIDFKHFCREFIANNSNWLILVSFSIVPHSNSYSINLTLQKIKNAAYFKGNFYS